MNIVISNTSDKPIYQQMIDQISGQIIRGELSSDQGLPPIRTVAKELRVSIITVKKAWEQLERDGFIYSMVGRGCFVADLLKTDLVIKRDDLITVKMLKDIDYYKEMGLSLQEIIEAIKKLFNQNKTS
ncbi:MAG: GntR family transcriptional regulator [Bacteroidetes bacterium]|nr:GntR family transcriptional regulator [Bacteroidota bacterium]